jgi:hypothetical protein
LSLQRDAPPTGITGGTSKSRLLSKTTQSIQKMPKDYLPMLKDGRVNKNVMEKIKISLKHSDWVSKFIESNGIQIVSAFLFQLLTKKMFVVFLRRLFYFKKKNNSKYNHLSLDHLQEILASQLIAWRFFKFYWVSV